MPMAAAVLPTWVLPTGITAGNVEMYGEDLDTDEDYSGTTITTAPWSAVFELNVSDAGNELFFRPNQTSSGNSFVRFNETARIGLLTITYDSSTLSDGHHTIFIVQDGSQIEAFADNVSIGSELGQEYINGSGTIAGATYTRGLLKYAVYNVALTSGQRSELHTDMLA